MQIFARNWVHTPNFGLKIGILIRFASPFREKMPEIHTPFFKSKCKKLNRKVQEEPQAEVAANPWHQEEEKKWHRLTCA